MSVTPAPVDDRSFESSVALTPEQVVANTEHFAGKGLEYSVRNLDEEGKPVAEVAKVADTAVADKPADNAAPADADIDADAKAAHEEIQSAKTDGERLGHHAKRTKQIKELRQEVETTKAVLSTKEALLAEKDRTIELLKSGAPAPGSAPSPFAPPAQAAPAPAVQAPPVEEEIKPKPFDKAAPKEPVWEDILASDATDDPYKAYADAGIKFNRESLQYELDKRDHDRTQATEVERAKQDRSQKEEQKRKAADAENKRFEEISTRIPDFLTVTSSVPYTPILRYCLRDRVSNGLDLAYQLAKPENIEIYKELAEKFPDKTRTEDETIADIQEAILELGGARRELKKSANGQTPEAAKPAEQAPPAVVPAAKPNGTGAQPQQSSSTQPPRIEEAAAPAPARGRSGGVAKRLEDFDPEDSDGRRAFKKANALM